MAIFNNMTITNKGKLLYAKAQAGVELKFTKMQVGSGTIGTQNPETLIALVAAKYDIPIQSITPNIEAKTATISAMMNNEAVTDSVYICEIGLFARDPDDGEILYAYGSAGTYGDYFAPATSGPYSWNYQIIAAVGNAANVTVELSNLNYDYGLISTNTTFYYLVGGNQKEINKSIDNLFRSYLATNSGNTYAITVPNIATLKDGFPVRVKFNEASTDSTALKINSIVAKPIVDYFGNPVKNIRKNLIANLCYESVSDSFILQGKGGGGDVTADQVLSGKRFTSDLGQGIGIMPENGELKANLDCGQSFNIPSGHTNGGIIKSNSLASQTPANADASKILAGFSAWVNGNQIDGQATIRSLGGIQMAHGTYTQDRFIYKNTSIYINIGGEINFNPKIIFGTNPYFGIHSFWMYVFNAGGSDPSYFRLIIDNCQTTNYIGELIWNPDPTKLITKNDDLLVQKEVLHNNDDIINWWAMG